MADGLWQDGGLADLWPGFGVEVDGLIARGADNSMWVSDEGITGGSDPVLTGAGPITDNTVTWTRIPDWPVSTAVAAGNRRQATTEDGHLRTAQNDFTTGSSEPTWVTDGTTNTDGVASASTGGYGPSATEVRMYFDAWASDDLTGDCIGTIEQVREMTYRGVDNGTGQGSFVANRHDDNELFATDNLVRVRVDPDGPFAYDDPRYFGAFFIETGEDTILADEDAGGEEVTLSGGGIEGYLKRARIDFEAHHPFNQTAGREFDRTVPKDWQWHINASEFDSPTIGTPGSVLRALLRDADSQTPNPIPFTSTYPTGHDFNVNHDSNGVAWSDGATDWTLDVGMTLDDLRQTLVNGGLYYKMLSSFKLRAFEEQQGVDRSADVVFTAGVDVADAGTRQIEASGAVSRTMVHGALANGRHTGLWTTEFDSAAHHDDLGGGSIEGEIGVRQGYLDYPASPTATRLAKAGKLYVQKSKDQHDGPPTIGVVNSVGKVAFVDYFPGDTVGTDIPEFGSSERVHAITLKQRDSNGSVDPILEFVGDPETNPASPIGAVASVSSVTGGAEYGDGTQPVNRTVTLAEDELLLLWWFPPDGALTVDGSPPAQVNDSGMGFKQGPGTFVISLPLSDSQFQYVVVSGDGRIRSGT